MRVRLLPADKAACSLYRLEHPARVASLQHDVPTTIDRQNFAIPDAPWDGQPVVVEARRNADESTTCTPWDEDVVVLQRPAREGIVALIPALQARGIAVVVDIDDDFSCLHPLHPSRPGFHPRGPSEQSWHHVARACGLADLVTVTTPALAERYGAHGRVAVLPNCVPRSMLELPSQDRGRTVGWGGRASIHPGDLETTRGGVGEALERMRDWRFRVIGPAETARIGLSLREKPEATGGLEMGDYFEALGQLDVGVVPLARTRFNEAKSWLKGLEYAARGVPFVASPLPEYRALAEEGVGVLAADRSRNWRAELVQLMRDESLRWEAIARGREVVEERHTYETEGWRWTEAWGHALQTRRALGQRQAA